jgi:hypothetical protein
MLCRFPYPVQTLIQSELRCLSDEGELEVELRKLNDDITCSCLFYRKWQLPCRHILLQHRTFGAVLTDEYYNQWHWKWEDSGFDMYEGMTTDYINNGIENDIGAPARRKLQVREVLDGLLARYYDLEAETSAWPDDAQDEAIRSWLKDLDIITGSLRQVAVEQLKKQLAPESQEAIEAAASCTQAQGFDYEELEG